MRHKEKQCKFSARAYEYQRWLETTISNRVDYERLTEYLYFRLTDMENAVLLWLEWGFSEAQIAEHFELSRERVRQLKNQIGEQLHLLNELMELREKRLNSFYNDQLC